MLDDAAVLLGHSRQETGHVYKGDERDVEAVTEADEPGRLDGSADVQHSRKHGWLVGDHAHRLPAQPGKADDDVAGVVRLHLEKRTVVHDPLDHLPHVVWAGRAVGYDVEQLLVPAVIGIGGMARRRLVKIVAGHVRHQFADGREAFGLGVVGEVRHA